VYLFHDGSVNKHGTRHKGEQLLYTKEREATLVNERKGSYSSVLRVM